MPHSTLPKHKLVPFPAKRVQMNATQEWMEIQLHRRTRYHCWVLPLPIVTTGTLMSVALQNQLPANLVFSFTLKI